MTPLEIDWEPASFRDRTARVFYRRDGVYRMLTAPGEAIWRRVQASGLLDSVMSSGQVVMTQDVDTAQWSLPDDCTHVLQHARVPFISYPYEWSFSMLRDAGLLQLDLMLMALQRGLIMKDASPFNVAFHEGRPVFLDVGSFHPLEPGMPWQAYGQFCRMVLYPLLLTAYKGVPFQPWLRGSLDGISAGQMRGLFGTLDMLRPGVLVDVVLHEALERRAASASGVRARVRGAGVTPAMITANVRRLQRLLHRLEWRQSTSAWSGYAAENPYSDDDTRAKEQFVERALGARRWPLAWDVGANTGHYSRIAAAHADLVLALEADPLCVEHLYRGLGEAPSAILPLVMNLADASPGLGWRGLERKPLAARGRPSVVLCLAVLHHLVLTANLRLSEIVDWLADLGACLVIEFVDRSDPMIVRLLERRDEPCDEYARDVFETHLRARFDITEQREVCGGHRVLYAAHPHS